MPRSTQQRSTPSTISKSLSMEECTGSSSHRKATRSSSRRQSTTPAAGKRRKSSVRRQLVVPPVTNNNSQVVAYVTPPRVPNDIIYLILAQVIGTYFRDLVLSFHLDSYSTCTLTSVLSVCHSFRAIAAQFIHYLWGGAFVNSLGACPRLPTDYGEILSSLCKLSRTAHVTPITLVTRPRPFFRTRLLRHPIHPFVVLTKFYLINIGRINAHKARKLWDHRVPIEQVFDTNEVDLGQLAIHYQSIPDDLRVTLLGGIWIDLLRKVVVWQRLRVLSATIDALFNLLGHEHLKTLPQQQRARLETEIEKQLEKAQYASHTLQINLQRVAGAASLHLQHLPHFTADELGYTKFYRLLGVFDSMAQYGRRFRGIRETGLDCVRIFLSEEEISMHMD